MKRILFVDDEPAVLDGIRDRLRKQRREWEMVFACGGDAALAECAQRPFDVVVSDMRMPGMDGATLLGLVRDLYPSTMRIVLSGHAEREAVVRALSAAHQYLSKPCDVDALRLVLQRACAVQETMADPTLRSLVGGVPRIPSSPRVHADLTAAFARGSPPVEEVVHIVERDPGICLKLLQIAASPLFGTGAPVHGAHDAVIQLGAEVMRSLVLAAEVFAPMEGAGGLSESAIAAIQRHSLRVAQLARKIGGSVGEDAFTAGMVHDCGQVVLALGGHVTPGEIEDQRLLGFAGERDRLGVTHAEVGAYLLGMWGLPLGIVEAVAGHHGPGRLGGIELDAMTIVHVAEALVTEVESSGSAAPLDEAHLDRLGVLARVPAWRDVARRIQDDCP